MSYHPMTEAEWRSFLRSPVRPAVLATVRPDGRPHAAPIWYALDGDDLVFNTGRDTVKGRNIRSSGLVSLVVQDDQPPFSYAVVEGRAEIVEDLDPAELRRWAARIGGRYMGADRAEEYGRRNGVPEELLVRLTPLRVVAVRDVAE